MSGCLLAKLITVHNISTVIKVCAWLLIQRKMMNRFINFAGFAVSLKLLLENKEARIDPNALRGHLETSLLEQLVTLNQLEPRGDNCTKVAPSHPHTCTLTLINSLSLSLSLSRC